MMAKPNTNERHSETLARPAEPGSTLLSLARRVIHTASLAVMVHGELDARTQRQAEDKDV
jgi:hypothetical protein